MAVLTRDHDDGESARTSYAAVVAFTTREGTVVTARFRAAPRRSDVWDLAFVVGWLPLGAAAAVTGVVLL